jgi:succinoglycan biosynthesis protein ExoA
MSGETQPPVEITIIVPVRNERHTIDAALNSLLSQVVDAEFEVLAIDGASEDDTRQVLEARAQLDHRLRVIGNPARRTGHALNIGLAAARGTFWLRVDAHSELPEDYVQRLVGHLRSGRSEAAGGVVKGLGSSPFGKAAAALQDTRFGIGNSRHHYSTDSTYVDHLSHGMYRVDLSRAIGGFDEGLIRNEDFDFDYRYGLAGGRILLDCDAWFLRRVRDSPVRLASQFHQYGYWKYIVLRRHPRSLHLRWLAPPMLVAGLSTGLVFSRTPGGKRLLAAIGVPYLGVVAAGSAVAGLRVGRRHLPHAALAMVTMHVAWGSGFLRSALTHAVRPGHTGPDVTPPGSVAVTNDSRNRPSSCLVV